MPATPKEKPSPARYGSADASPIGKRCSSGLKEEQRIVDEFPQKHRNELAQMEGDTNALDLTSKRMIAAMKITGIQPSDLEPEPYPADSATDKEVRRFEVKDQKRRNLLGDLQEAADSLDARDIDALISGPGSVDDSTFFLAEKAKIDKQRERNRAELKRRAAYEVERQQIMIRAERDREATTRRVREQKEEKAKQEHARMEQKRQKVEANIKAAKDREKQRHKMLEDKLDAREEKVGKNLDALLKDREGRVGQLQDKFDQNARRLYEHQQMEEEAKMQKAYNNSVRMSNLEGFLADREAKQQRDLMDSKAEFSGRNLHVASELANQREGRERAAAKRLKKIEQAREHAANNWTTLSASVKEKREQRMQKWIANQQANNADKRQRTQKLQAEINASESRSQKAVEKYRENTLGKYTATREIYLELVQENQYRIARSDQMTREHRIDRINFHNACKESRQDQKTQATSYRVEAFREQVHGQSQVDELHHLLGLTARSSPSSRCGSSPRPVNPAVTDRVNHILTNLGVDVPPSVLGITEGEDAEGGQATGGRGEGQGK